jgi:hypothetical protein
MTTQPKTQEISEPTFRDPELRKIMKSIPAIDYRSDNVKFLQQEGAQALDALANEFAEKGVIKDKARLALVLIRLADVQVRDYAMGITNEENIETMWSMWRWLVSIAPHHYIAPAATILAAISYEKGDGKLARQSIEQAIDDDSKYPLARLLNRVFAAGWPASSFASMRAELHPKVCALIFGEEAESSAS